VTTKKLADQKSDLNPPFSSKKPALWLKRSRNINRPRKTGRYLELVNLHEAFHLYLSKCFVYNMAFYQAISDTLPRLKFDLILDYLEEDELFSSTEFRGVKANRGIS